MKLRFTKMHGCGNDYIYFDCFRQSLSNIHDLAIRLSDRHFGIGGDGIVLICPSEVADAKMRMFNADGSEGKMCGNAIRCVGKFLADRQMIAGDEVSIETLSGVKSLKLFRRDGIVNVVQVDMGKALLDSASIPVTIDQDRIVNYPVQIDDLDANITCVSMGNPHCVVFCEEPYALDLNSIGPKFERSPLFPEQVNTEFVHVLDDHTLRMRVWERGSGETWACGTGACAAVVAAVENGFCKPNSDVTVHLRGGDLCVRYTMDSVFMTGNAEVVFEGEVEA